MPPPLLRGRYRLDDIIGNGGAATVHRAHDQLLGRDVALKIFRASATAETDFRRQEDEVNLLAGLTHPNLVTLLDAAVDRCDAQNPRIYYAMEFVDGTDLKHRLEGDPMTARNIALTGYDIASALEYVHHHGIVHRDVKPANILLGTAVEDPSRTRAKLGDFGVASVGAAQPISDDEVVTGTVAYLSPEQARGESVGVESDVYSLGLVLLQCFTRRLAFDGPPQHSAMARLLDDPEIGNEVPQEWHSLLRAMTSRAPADRPSIRDVARSLRELSATESARHRQDDGPAADGSSPRAPSDEVLDRVTALAARVLRTPLAIASIVDSERVWFTAHHSLDVDKIGVVAAIKASDFVRDEPWVVPDASVDSQGNPLLTEDLGMAFYAGVPLRTTDDRIVGTLCVLGVEPRELTTDEIATLDDLAALAVRAVEFDRE